MDINFLIQVLERRVIILSNAKSQAAASGDLDTYNTVDQELLGVQTTLVQLQGLSSDTSSSSSTATVTTQGPSASAIVNGYDISAYATDPLYEQKIMSILASMPAFALASDLTAYIQSVAPGAPVTGDMIFAAAEAYNVDIPLMTAIMQNDSQFGTQGIGASTYNPGNVGNTGYATQTYPSWDAGVLAVAQWLSNHRALSTATAATTAATTASTSASDAATSTAATTASTSTDSSASSTAASTTASTASSGSSTTDSSTATTSPAVSTATSTAPTSTATSSSATSTESAAGTTTSSASSSAPVDTSAASSSSDAATSTADAGYATTTSSTGN